MFNKSFIAYLSTVLEYLLPSVCVLCTTITKAKGNICSPCRESLPFLRQYCKRCAQYLPDTPTLCGTCIQNPPPFAQTFALFPYEPPIIQMISALKFQHKLEFGATFSQLLLEKIQTSWYQHQSLPQALIPIPLHRQRLRERGFNQALELAKPLAKALNIPLLISPITRIKATSPQSSLPAAKRRENITNAFHITLPINYQHIAVLDDVITTGHTMREFCHTLVTTGVQQIDVWCCARVQESLTSLSTLKKVPPCKI